MKRRICELDDFRNKITATLSTAPYWCFCRSGCYAAIVVGCFVVMALVGEKLELELGNLVRCPATKKMLKILGTLNKSKIKLVQRNKNV